MIASDCLLTANMIEKRGTKKFLVCLSEVVGISLIRSEWSGTVAKWSALIVPVKHFERNHAAFH